LVIEEVLQESIEIRRTLSGSPRQGGEQKGKEGHGAGEWLLLFVKEMKPN